MNGALELLEFTAQAQGSQSIHMTMIDDEFQQMLSEMLETEDDDFFYEQNKDLLQDKEDAPVLAMSVSTTIADKVNRICGLTKEQLMKLHRAGHVSVTRTINFLCHAGGGKSNFSKAQIM